jgi:hypothetical protein
MPEPNVAALAATYRKIRTARKELKRDFDARDQALEQQENVIGQALLDICKASDASSIKTTAGTVIRSKRNRFWATDWEALHNYVLSTGSVDLLERRVAQGAAQAWLDAHEGEMLPGVTLDSKYVVSVRKPD